MKKYDFKRIVDFGDDFVWVETYGPPKRRITYEDTKKTIKWLQTKRTGPPWRQTAPIFSPNLARKLAFGMSPSKSEREWFCIKEIKDIHIELDNDNLYLYREIKIPGCCIKIETLFPFPNI